MGREAVYHHLVASKAEYENLSFIGFKGNPSDGTSVAGTVLYPRR
jgi:hypothetical protein